MKNSERKIRKKKKPDTEKSYLICYYYEYTTPYSDNVYHEIKNMVINAKSKKEAYDTFKESRTSKPNVLNIICLDD